MLLLYDDNQKLCPTSYIVCSHKNGTCRWYSKLAVILTIIVVKRRKSSFIHCLYFKSNHLIRSNFYTESFQKIKKV